MGAFLCCQGGKDAASARYIYTKLSGLARHLFNEADDQLLDYLNEDGQRIEPNWCVGGTAWPVRHSKSFLPASTCSSC